MCFSATASLVAGGALVSVGAATVQLARARRELPLASIPLMFGLQQLIDGAVWLTPGAWAAHIIAVYAYALLAFVLWPIFVPLALLPIEQDKTRREVLEALAVVGLGVGLFFLYFITFGTVTAQVVNHCVAYDTPHPFSIGILAFYLIATCGPFFVSKNKMLNLFGTVLFASFAIAGWFYIETFSSTWCFFSAVLGVILYMFFKNKKHSLA